MSDDNGSGGGGGNSSVWWEVRHGSAKKPQQLAVAGLGPVGRPPAARMGVAVGPARGEVKVSNAAATGSAKVEIHDSTDLTQIGSPDHSGMFRVRLRIRKTEMDRLIADEKDAARKAKLRAYWDTLPGLAAQLEALTAPPPHPEDEVWNDQDQGVFLVIDVPAIERKPKNGGPWPYLPWEIHWEW